MLGFNGKKFFLLMSLSLLIATKSLHSQAIKVGEKCIDLKFDSIINFHTSQAKLSDFKGKLIILDFWATYCSSCILGFPEMERLQNLFKDKILILPITDQSNAKGRVPEFWNTNNITRKLSLPTVLDQERVVSRFFPREELGMFVWIDKDGIVKGITSEEYVNEKNILAVLNDHPFNFPQKGVQKLFKYDIPFVNLTDNGAGIPDKYYYSIFTGHLNNVAPKSTLIDDNSRNLTRYYNVNQTILDFYKFALSLTNMKGMFNRIKVETKDSSRFFYNPHINYKDQWFQENSFCYEALFPNKLSNEKLFVYIINDLNKFFYLNSRIELRLTKCLKIISNSKQDIHGAEVSSIISKFDGYKASYKSVKDLTDVMNRLIDVLPVIDATGKAGNKEVTLFFTTEINEKFSIKNLKDIEGLRNQLNYYGFDIIRDEIEMPILLISDETSHVNVTSNRK